MKVLIVDGHSVLFGWPELRAMHDSRRIAAREHLVRLLTSYQDATAIKVIVVFDGRTPKAGDDSAPGGIQVFYSSQNQTADDIIERLVAKYGKEHDITVATNDTLEQQTVYSFGGSWMSVESLSTVLGDAEKDLRTRIKRHNASD